jgi:hypothetical protein
MTDEEIDLAYRTARTKYIELLEEEVQHTQLTTFHRCGRAMEAIKEIRKLKEEALFDPC